MADLVEVKTCSNPGCDQPGTKACSACKITFYCCVICQTADWNHHKDECPGHLLKVGKANLVKAMGFEQQRNWGQSLYYAEIAATKLKQLKDRSLETVQLIDTALRWKFNALQRLGRHREAKECAEERYTLWAMNHIRNAGSMEAALKLIESCLHNKDYDMAEHYARHAMSMINEASEVDIPANHRLAFLAEGSYWLATAILNLAESGGIPPEGKQKAGEEAIELAREALRIRTQLLGTESARVALAMTTLADVLDYFNDVDNDEVLRLHAQSNAITCRVEGSSSFNVAAGENNLGAAYSNRAKRAEAVNDLDRCLANYELALPNYREAARIFRAINHMDNADLSLFKVAQVEEIIRQIGIARAAAAGGTG